MNKELEDKVHFRKIKLQIIFCNHYYYTVEKHRNGTFSFNLGSFLFLNDF